MVRSTLAGRLTWPRLFNPVPETDEHEAPEHEAANDFSYGVSLLMDGEDPSSSASVPNAEGSALESAAAASMSEAARFEGRLDDEAIEAMTKSVVHEMDNDLELMRGVEQELLQNAISRKDVTVEQIQSSVDRYCGEGMSPDDAVLEAVLNSSQVLGNANVAHEAASATAECGEAASNPTDPEVVAAHQMSSKQRKHCAFVSFCAALIEGIRSILMCLQSHAMPPTASDLEGNPLSLVMSPVDIEGQVSFPNTRRLLLISWEIRGKTGRVARVDSDFRLVSMMCVGKNRYARNFETCAVIMSNAGVVMERVKKQNRARLPEHVIRLAKIFMQTEQHSAAEAEEQLRRSGPDSAPEQWANIVQPVSDCVYCGRSICQASSGSSESSGLPTECPLRLLCWHDECADSFSLDHSPVVLNPPALPTAAGSAVAVTWNEFQPSFPAM